MSAPILNTLQITRYLYPVTGEGPVNGCVRDHSAIPHTDSAHGYCDNTVGICLACDGIHLIPVRHNVQLQFLREDVLAANRHAC
jgi:hypothetical protein